MIAEPQVDSTQQTVLHIYQLQHSPRSTTEPEPYMFYQHDTYTQVGSIHTGLKVDRLLWTKKLLWIEYLDKN
ncbi:unnamed protein product [Plutella xylostella]|uniref:(diamondback moth) hypothetical protein n=1 Tax=Plutella xylostella TaxID=51655 RepID=A0A8S4G2L0_PLUXY|nr:unnamed protein product [Plutella xylostella]